MANSFTRGLTRVFGSANQRALKRLLPIVQRINALEEEYQALPPEAFRERAQAWREQLEAEEVTLDDILPEVFAAVREASRRTIGLRHYDVQLLGGIVLHQGAIAEMKTGEGKTLVATLPVTLNALAGKGAHLITVNDYLARRDVQWMGPIYDYLGLSVGSIIHDTSLRFDPTYIPKDYRFLHLREVERRDAYQADITYGTNNEFGFDYLRDNMKLSLDEYVQRELHYAIVDEVDNILVDEARTPLIISGPAQESSEMYRLVNRIIPRLTREVDYAIDEEHRNATLTEEGVAKCERLLGVANLYDPSQIGTLHHVTQALKAHTIFKRDVDYVVKDNQVVIVDEFTGRLMEGRRWSDGLHQAVEAKEGARIESENVTLATITIQNYFRMYSKLGGMTGTADTESVEFKKTYNLEVFVVPSNKTLSRVDQPDVVFKSEREKFAAVVEEIRECSERGQPVLVGTTSVEKSEHVSKLLKKARIRHNVLNAINHEAEANIIAQAGRHGAVTIATNMAGRGTDILLGGNPDFLARSEMENEWIRSAGKGKAQGSDAGDGHDERYEDKLRGLRERYDDALASLREQYGARLAELQQARSESLKARLAAENALRDLSPYRDAFARYERSMEADLVPAVDARHAVPASYDTARRSLEGAFAEAGGEAVAPARALTTRLGGEFEALLQVWDEVRGHKPDARQRREVTFRAMVAEALLAAVAQNQRMAVVDHVLERDADLAEAAERWRAAAEAGRSSIGAAPSMVREAVVELLVRELPAERVQDGLRQVLQRFPETAVEGLNDWRSQYEKAYRDLELALMLDGPIDTQNDGDDEAARWRREYQDAETAFAEAERLHHEQQEPFDAARRAEEQRYERDRKQYVEAVDELRETMQKAPQQHEAREKEIRASYETLCAEEREKVVGLGGLHIIGTERHEARRIDNQLRGRAGRQGDPGSSRFFLSLEDDLLRIFGADRMQNLMERLGMEEGVPIEHRLVTRAIKNAQDKVEARNFDMRKHLLEYDDVLNKQREVIYARRRQVLTGADLSEEIMGMAETIAAELVASHCSDTVPPEDWDLKALDDAVFGQFALRLNLPETAAEMERPGAVEELVVEAVHEAYRQREESFTPPVTRHLERALWLQTLDDLWREHLVNMDHLKEGIGLRGYAQKNPLNEYQKEGYELFEEMLGRMEADIVEKMMSVQLQQQAAAARPAVAAAAGGAPATADMPPEIEALERRQRAAQRTRMRLSHAGSGGGTEAARPETVRRDESKVGRNDPCPCGSGKKYKKCHGREA
jgi:preprotein translocase SecA subunit